MSTYPFDQAWDKERSRLGGLEQGLDPGTIRHLEALAVGPGWRCWEVGAGAEPRCPTIQFPPVLARSGLLGEGIDSDHASNSSLRCLKDCASAQAVLSSIVSAKASPASATKRLMWRVIAPSVVDSMFPPLSLV